MKGSATTENNDKIIIPTVLNNTNYSGDVTIVSNRSPSLKTKETNNLLPEKSANETNYIAFVNGDFPIGLRCCDNCKKK